MNNSLFIEKHNFKPTVITFTFIFSHMSSEHYCVFVFDEFDFFFNLKCLLICFSIDNLIENDRRSLCPTKLLKVGWVPIF